MTNTLKYTALYSRLSKGDKDRGADESGSIKNQKMLLENYASNERLLNIKHYIDDDESGRFLDRPAYQEMIEDVKKGLISTVIMKDMSRWGRNYLGVENDMEFFRVSNVRFIAISDSIDSNDPASLEFAPFRNILAEMTAKDTSKKIRASVKIKGMSGKPLCCVAPYGFKKHPDDKFLWVIDEEVAEVVKRIFALAMDGLGPYQICTALHNDKVEIPGYYFKKQGIGHHRKNEFKNPYAWGSSTIEHILRNRAYVGDTVNFKTEKHFKDKKSKYVDESKWVIFENTHEAIVSRELFENVQRLRAKAKKKRPKGHDYIHPLAGLIYCKDCGNIHNIHRIYNGKDKPTAICSKYARGKQQVKINGFSCPTSHRIDCGKLLTIIQQTLKSVTDYALQNKEDFEKLVKESLSSQHTTEVKKQKSRVPVIKNRLAELDTILMTIYEDKALGKIPERHYMTLSDKYATEQATLEAELTKLESMLERYDHDTDRANKFIKLVEKYANFDNLTASMLNEFIDKIVIHEREIKSSISSPQQVDIHFVYIGELANLESPKEPTQKELEELALAQARRDKFKENYQKRKANGKQQQYDKQQLPKRIKRKQAEREKIFDDGYTLGQDVLAI